MRDWLALARAVLRPVAEIAEIPAAPPPGRISAIRAISAVGGEAVETALAMDCTGDFEERAAIIEANGVPREWAEGFAHLDTMACPPGVAFWRWQQIVDDAGRFLDRWGHEAAALGWQALNVFGINARAPFARTDHMGLAILIGGGDVTAITRDSATIRTPTGAVQTFRRRPATEPEQIALWQLPPLDEPRP